MFLDDALGRDSLYCVVVEEVLGIVLEIDNYVVGVGAAG